ncbi:MAG: bacteriocin [Lachnospiraceae bacterium]|nr:bacteriocin [Lachnospiraceae bacterium]
MDEKTIMTDDELDQISGGSTEWSGLYVCCDYNGNPGCGFKKSCYSEADALHLISGGHDRCPNCHNGRLVVKKG